MNPRHVLAGLTFATTTLVGVAAGAQTYATAPLAVAVPPGPVAVPPGLPVAVPPGTPMAVPYVPPGHGPGYAPRWFRPDGRFFVYRTRARADQIGAQLRASVAQHLVHPRALWVFAERRAQLEGMLARSTNYGFVAFPERQQIENLLAAMTQLDEQFRFRGWRPWGWRR
jgi:hypothetical protein